MASLSPTSAPHLSRSLEASSAGSDKSHPAVKTEHPPPEAPPAAPRRAPLPSQPKSAAAPQAPFVRISLPPVNKMSMTAVISPSPQTEQPQPKMSMTSKEWVIPPRPKPGRKPATDTPPTKRKAQNRAAQRAFRERRAARVGELEEMLDEHKKAQDTREKEMTDQIRNLELDVQSFRSRCLLLESMLERERQERIRAEMQAETLSRRYEQANFRSESLGSLPPPYGRQHQQQHQPQQRHSLSDSRMGQQQNTSRHFSISQIVTPPDMSDMQSPHEPSETHLTCGSCSPNGRCACAEEVLASVVTGCGKCGFGTACQCLDDSAKVSGQGPELKRPLSPSGGVSQEKRQRPMAAASTETDFTSLFSRPSQQQPLPQPSSIISQLPSADTLPFRDSCGFCKDGTYCVCADAAMATPAMTPADASPPVTRQTRTPPPLESDVVTPLPPMAMEMTADGAVKLPRRKPARSSQPQPQADSTAARGSCGPNGPGTCAQCQADPKSGLFCRLMVASFNREQGGASAGGGCCGGKGPGGGCCKSKPSQEKITLPSLPSLGLSCADAYQTLSSHSNFEQAADEIGSWLPKLKAHPTSDPRAAQAGRIPIEVEAASIMSVLKEFDVRFGREC